MRQIKPFSEEQLIEMQIVDTTPRVLKGDDVVEFKCHSCNNTGNSRIDNSRRRHKMYGFYFQCEVCLKEKYKNRGEDWLNNLRASCQTEAKKKVAVENSIKRMKHKKLNNVEMFWDFNEVDIQNTQGSLTVTGCCRSCSAVTNSH
jgi:hypothetical protein